MISDEQIEKGLMAFVFCCEVKVGPAQAGWMYDALQELKQRRESDLRPATKFLGQNFGQLIGKVCSECDEVIEAWDDDFDQCLERLPKEAYNDILMELVDVQMACETALTKILPDQADRDEARRQVIEKNAKRGYYEGAE